MNPAACYLVLTKSSLLSYSFGSSLRNGASHSELGQTTVTTTPTNKYTGQSDVNSFSTQSLFLDCGKLLKTGQYVSAAASACCETN